MLLRTIRSTLYRHVIITDQHPGAGANARKARRCLLLSDLWFVEGVGHKNNPRPLQHSNFEHMRRRLLSLLRSFAMTGVCRIRRHQGYGGQGAEETKAEKRLFDPDPDRQYG